MSPKALRVLLTVTTAVLVCGCGTLPGGDTGDLYRLAKTLVTGGSDVTLAEAAAVPYASIGVRLGSSNQIMLVLASNENGVSLWTSAARVAIMTRQGRIVQTAGLGRDLGGVQMPTVPSGANDDRFDYLVDLPDMKLYSVQISCRRQRGPAADIVILGTTIKTQIVRESCAATSGSLDWEFRNTFWTDPDTGFVWRSIQHTHPKLDPIEIEALRTPA